MAKLLVLPCRLNLRSRITVVGRLRGSHQENDPNISLRKEGDEAVMVSQLHMELQGLRIVEGEEPPRILHFNPRLKGDWSGKPLIKQNTCYRMQWETALRCKGWKSKADEETRGSGLAYRRMTGQTGSEQFVMRIPNNKVVPLHPPPGDTSTERSVHIDGTQEQIEAAKQLVNDAISAVWWIWRSRSGKVSQ